MRKTPPLNGMHCISASKLNSMKILPKDGWSALHRRTKGIDRNSSSDRLADGFAIFMEIWQFWNGYDIEIEEPVETRKSAADPFDEIQIFYCCRRDKYVYWRSRSRNLYSALLDRYVDYLEGD